MHKIFKNVENYSMIVLTTAMDHFRTSEEEGHGKETPHYL